MWLNINDGVLVTVVWTGEDGRSPVPSVGCASICVHTYARATRVQRGARGSAWRGVPGAKTSRYIDLRLNRRPNHGKQNAFLLWAL